MQTRVDRIQKDLEALSRFSTGEGMGVTRSSYTVEDQQAKAYLIQEMKTLGLMIYEDGFGTLFGRWEGKMSDAPVVMFGSHYDTVVNAGAFDGTAGCVAALEVMRVLKEADFQPTYPLELVFMNAEEGATFGPSTGVSNSRAMAGTMSEEELDSVYNRFGQTKREAMAAYGLYPDLKQAKRKQGSIKNFVELHVEQGPELARKGVDIGLVSYLAGIGRFTVKFYGETADSTALMKERKDALVAASSFITCFDTWIKTLGDDITGMVGELTIVPNSNQFVPEYVEGKIEIRINTKDMLTTCDVKSGIMELLETCKRDYGIRVEMEEIRRINYPNPTGPSVMHAGNIKRMENICKQLGYQYCEIHRGTGHDAMIMCDVTDTNMIYVPSRNGGVSHCPQEWSEYEDVKKGSDVLLHLIQQLSE